MKNKIISLILTIVILAFDIIFIITPNIEFSDMENRYLSQMPKFKISNLLNGKYMDNITDYLKDQFPFRNQFVGLKILTEKLVLKKEINGIYLSHDNYLIEKYQSIKDKDKLIRIFNNFDDHLNINLKLLLVPTSIAFNYDKLPAASIYDNQLDDINYIYNNINFDSINVYNVLKKHNETSNMYYKLDHHWTTDGAYYAYTEIAKSFGYNAYSKTSFVEEEVSTDFYGTLYSKVNDYTRKSDSIKLYRYSNNLDVYYDDDNKHTNSLYEYSYLSKKDKYAMFLDNNHSLIIITNNDIESEDELIVIKDSYANSLIPFLVNHYKRIHVIDPRYYNGSISEYICNNSNINNGLILYNMATIEDDLGVYTIK